MELLNVVVKALDDVKACDITVLDMKGISPLFDYMVIATSTNSRQSSALIHNVKEECEKNDFDIRGVEGKDEAWVLIDCKDIIVNVFTKEEREHYGLEKLYLDVKRVDVNKLLGE